MLIDKKDLKSLIFIFLILLVLTVILLIIREVRSGNLTGASVIESNIKQAAPTPTSCTRTQNCGSSGCGAAGGGSCGAATGGSCGG